MYSLLVLIDVVIFIVVPKNSGLEEYRDKTLACLPPSKTIEVRGEDVPFWVEWLQKNGKKAIGLTGEDLYREYCLNKKTRLKIIKKIIWDDPKALFRKPALCLIGPKKKSLPKTICISSKYRKLADSYLKSKGIKLKKIYVNGSSEESCAEGIADLIIDIVYTGASLKKYNLKVYDRITASDFVIIGGEK